MGAVVARARRVVTASPRGRTCAHPAWHGSAEAGTNYYCTGYPTQGNAVKRAPHSHPVRYWLVLGTMLAAMSLLAARAVYLQVWHSGYLQEQGNARHLRIVEDVSHRGMILDRNGEPLAISTPVDSVWADPAEVDLAH